MAYPLLAPCFKYGYLGVELFFMISGFVILMTAANGSLSRFVISRIVRLYPAYWICCTATFIVIVLWGAPHYTTSFAKFVVNLTMLNTLVGVAPMDGVYWSLIVELRFYALVAALLVTRQIHRAQPFLIGWLAFSIAAQALPTGKVLNYLFVVDYSAYFIAGATCYLICSEGLTVSRAAMMGTSWMLAVYQALPKMQIVENVHHIALDQGVVTAIITSFFAAMLLIALKKTGWIGARRWLLAGALTYPLYLLHQNIGFIIFNAMHDLVNTHFLFWGTTAGVLVCAYLVNMFIERPFASKLKNALTLAANSLAQRAAVQAK